ncbi:hypothetical protein HpHA172_01290 [Helicobacter pylori]
MNFKEEIFGIVKTLFAIKKACFITLDGLKNLKERLFIDIINVINQKKRVALNHAQIDDIQYKERVALDYALINDIKYNFLDNTFHFIFDIDLHLIDD